MPGSRAEVEDGNGRTLEEVWRYLCIKHGITKSSTRLKVKVMTISLRGQYVDASGQTVDVQRAHKQLVSGDVLPLLQQCL